MASWYSNILTKTSTQISNIRTTLLSSEADGDTEDDTHVCRVLRDHYTEKGKPFPPWLPPDPKAPPPTQPLYAQSSSQVGARYGGGMGAQGGPGAGPQGGGLSSLWGSNGAQQQQQAAPQSLRAGRGAPQQQMGGGGGPGREQITARPLPSQRAGSYQNGPTPPPGVGGGSAQDRLRQRFKPGGSNSRGSSPGQTQNPYQAPAAGGYDGNAGSGGNNGAYTSSNSPWSSAGDSYGGDQGGGYQRSQPAGTGQRRGLPSGPRSYR